MDINVEREMTLEEFDALPLELQAKHTDWLVSDTFEYMDRGLQAMEELATTLNTPATAEQDAYLKDRGEAWYRKQAPLVAAIEDGAVALFNSRMAQAQKHVDARV